MRGKTFNLLTILSTLLAVGFMLAACSSDKGGETPDEIGGFERPPLQL